MRQFYYITKPFRFEELLARVKLRLRNSQVSQVTEEMLLEAGNIVLDLRTRKARVNSDRIDLPAREFKDSRNSFSPSRAAYE